MRAKLLEILKYIEMLAAGQYEISNNIASVQGVEGDNAIALRERTHLHKSRRRNSELLVDLPRG